MTLIVIRHGQLFDWFLLLSKLRGNELSCVPSCFLPHSSFLMRRAPRSVTSKTWPACPSPPQQHLSHPWHMRWSVLALTSCCMVNLSIDGLYPFDVPIADKFVTATGGTTLQHAGSQPLQGQGATGCSGDSLLNPSLPQNYCSCIQHPLPF